MPLDSHAATRSSISKIFVWAKYSTGFNPVSVARCWMAVVGLGRCFSLANQSTSSAIQKSGSSCTAIIMSWYMIKSPSIFAPGNCSNIGDMAF